MPVQSISESTANNLYCHVYNRGINDNIIFRDEADYNIFLNYLKEYLSTPTNTDASKKVFNIRGRAFYGTPHQPKNYYGKIELAAYSLSPNSFHLLLIPKAKDYVQGFIRSLTTRYSIYFNKKYHRVGAVFQGPYKSILIKDEICILYLTRFLHTQNVSSYQEYLGLKNTTWINSSNILLYFDRIKNSYIKDYKYFVEVHKPDQRETSILDKIILEEVKKIEPVKTKQISQASQKPKPRAVELIVANTIFFFLLTLGIGNINAPERVQHNLLSVSNLNMPKVLGIKTDNKVSIDIKDGQESIYIYKDSSIDSEKIGSAKHGASFELISVENEWTQIKLPNGLNGFVLSKYIKTK